MAWAKDDQHRGMHLDIGAPSSSSRTVLTPPEGATAFGFSNMAVGPTPAPHVAWACQIFSFLDKATRMPPTQRSASHLAPYARDFAQWLDQYCEFFGPLTLHTRPYSLLLDGELVYQDQQINGIAAQLFKCGVVALSWSPGVTSDEILIMLQILLSVEQYDDEDERDVVVRLWEAGFANITIDVYDRTPEPEPDVALQREEIVEALHSQLQETPLAGVNFVGLGTTSPAGAPMRSTTMPREHSGAIQSRLANENEEATLATRAGEFFLLTMTQLKEHREVKLLERWLLPVVSSLFVSRSFSSVVFLVDELFTFGCTIQPTLAGSYRELQSNILRHFVTAEHLESSIKLLESGGFNEERAYHFGRLLLAMNAVMSVRLSELLAEISSSPEALLSSLQAGHSR